MKKLILILMGIACMVSMTSCSSDDDTKNAGNGAVSTSELYGAFQVGDYQLNLDVNGGFTALNTMDGKTYAGKYSFSGEELTFSDVATRAFLLEPGKSYVFLLKRDGSNFTLTDKTTGEVYKMVHKNADEIANSVLSPEQEKEYIKETLEKFESYFEPNEWRKLTDFSVEFVNVSSGELPEWLDKFVEERVLFGKWTYVVSTEWEEFYDVDGVFEGQYPLYRLETYEYYDNLLLLTQMHGQFEANSKGSWKQVGDGPGLSFRLTDKDHAEWVMEISQSGSLGDIRYDRLPNIGFDDVISEDDFSDGIVTENIIENDRYTYRIPQSASMTLTRNGVEQMNCKINISKFNDCIDEDKVFSFLGHCDATIEMTVRPEGEPFHVAMRFQSEDKLGCTMSLRRGDTTLLYCEAGTSKEIDEDGDMYPFSSPILTMNVLGRLVLHLSATDMDELDSALMKVGTNRYDDEQAEKYRDRFNSSITAYITNGIASTIKQADVVFDAKPYEGLSEWYDEEEQTLVNEQVIYYKVMPALQFADGSKYIIDNEEGYFSSVINRFQEIADQLRDMVRIEDAVDE